MKKHFSLNLIAFCGVLITVGLVFLTILAATGSFHYRKTELTIRTGSAEKKYDGRPLTNTKWFLVSGEVAKEHELIVEPRGSQTVIGKSENVASIRVVDSSGLDVTDQYDIQTEYGELEVLRRKVVFQSASAEKVWDGLPLSQHAVYLAEGKIYDEGEWRAYDFASPDKVGTYQNTYEISITNSVGEDLSDNYEIVCEYGELTIRQGTLLLASGSASKEYDGEELSNDECRIVRGSVAEGHRLEMQAIGVVKEVGFSENTIQAKVLDSDGKDVTSLYDITYNTGLLTVTPRRLTIQTMDVTRPYYEKPIEDDWALVGGSLLDGDVLEVMTFQSYVNGYEDQVGTFDNTVLHYYIRDAQGYSSKTGCYQVSFQYGKVILTE